MSNLPLGFPKPPPPNIPASLNIDSQQINKNLKVPTPTFNEAAVNKKYVDDRTVNGYTTTFSQETPAAGNTSQNFQVALPSGTIGKLTSLRIRWDYTYGVGETSSIRLYRYRKVNGSFSYSQITDIIPINNTLDWSTWYNYDSSIRTFDLNTDTDTIVVTNIHTPGGSPTARALLVVFGVGVGDGTESYLLTSNPVSSWPPV